MMSIEKLLKDKRQSLGYTQKHLALQMGVHPKSVSRWEKGTSIPDINSLKQLSEVLEIPMDEFHDKVFVSKETKKEDPLALKSVHRFFAKTIVSIALYIIGFIVLLNSAWVSYNFTGYPNQNVEVYRIFGWLSLIVSFIFIVLSLAIFLIALFEFITTYKMKKIQSYYIRFKTKLLTAYLLQAIFIIIVFILLSP